jgi:calcium binding protein 39
MFRIHSPIVAKSTAALTALSTAADPKREENHAKVKETLFRMLTILYKRHEGEETSSRAIQLVNDISKSDFIPVSLAAFATLPLEQRKHFTLIFTASIAMHVGAAFPVAQCVAAHPEWIDQLLGLYAFPELAVSAGEMLRICTQHEALAQILRSPERLDELCRHFTESHFAVAADSFATFRVLMLSAPGAEAYIERNHETIVDYLNGTLREAWYTPCRQTLKLIGEMIMAFEDFQDRYLSNEQNLIIVMKLMVSTYRNLAMEAFHVFKLFVACQNKPETIVKILRTNRQKLVPYLRTLLDGVDDEQIEDEKNLLINILSGLGTR